MGEGRRYDDRVARAAEEVEPARLPAPAPDLSDFHGQLSRAVARALSECPKPRAEVAAEMARLLDQPSLSEAMLRAYASPGREHHRITPERIVALIHVTGARWLLDVLAKPLSLVVYEAEEAALLELGRIHQEIERLREREAELLRVIPARTRLEWRR